MAVSGVSLVNWSTGVVQVRGGMIRFSHKVVVGSFHGFYKQGESHRHKYECLCKSANLSQPSVRDIQGAPDPDTGFRARASQLIFQWFYKQNKQNQARATPCSGLQIKRP